MRQDVQLKRIRRQAVNGKVSDDNKVPAAPEEGRN